jgi:hypothetical protein
MPIIVGGNFLKVIPEEEFKMKFSEGEPVMFQKRMKATVVAVIKESDKPYGIVYTTPNNKDRTLFTTEEHLSKRKNATELSVGDRFKTKNEDTYEVIFITREECKNETVYIARIIKKHGITGPTLDYIRKVYPNDVCQIIY